MGHPMLVLCHRVGFRLLLEDPNDVPLVHCAFGILSFRCKLHCTYSATRANFVFLRASRKSCHTLSRFLHLI